MTKKYKLSNNSKTFKASKLSMFTNISMNKVYSKHTPKPNLKLCSLVGLILSPSQVLSTKNIFYSIEKESSCLILNLDSKRYSNTLKYTK